MGFDDYECLRCYLEGGGNNLCEDSEANVCFGCIDNMRELEGSMFLIIELHGL